MSGWALHIRGLEVRAPSGEPILTDVDWQLEVGESGVIVGPSGAGKSRLLRILDRLDEPARGQVEVLGRALKDWSVRELRRTVAWVPQRPALTPGTGRDCLDVVAELGLAPAGSAREARARMDQALEVAGVTAGLLERDVAVLSGGERHRLALARALLLAPRMLLLDEPSAALDGASAAALLQRLMAWSAQGPATLVVVTHRIEDVRALGGQMLALAGGRVARAGPSLALLDDPLGPGDYDVHALLTGQEAREAARQAARESSEEAPKEARA